MPADNNGAPLTGLRLVRRVLESDLPSALKPTLVTMATFERGDGIFPSVDRIAYLLGVSRRQAARHIRALRDMGALVPLGKTTGGRLASGRGLTTRYAIDVDALPQRAPFETPSNRVTNDRANPVTNHRANDVTDDTVVEDATVVDANSAADTFGFPSADLREFATSGQCSNTVRSAGSNHDIQGTNHDMEGTNHDIQGTNHDMDVIQVLRLSNKTEDQERDVSRDARDTGAHTDSDLSDSATKTETRRDQSTHVKRINAADLLAAIRKDHPSLAARLEASRRFSRGATTTTH